MKRREAKFVRASSGLSSDRMKAAPRVQDSKPRAGGRVVPRVQKEPTSASRARERQ